ncbi:Adenine phosphoribosyltransferase-like [Oopsacas minuta]|uniref:Adenine phosphoribosyltransferase n=1 Tax=Oopsacas minuta TaxID=111878 RepID=A0AAV7JN87_9METZ|nr:Adenine phosphoribosyltransferase-like [Oopsacas minuta]
MAKRDNPNREETIKQLKEQIREVPDFPIKGIAFQDIFSLLKSPVLLKTVINLLIEDAKSFGTNVDIVLGLDARGFLIGPSVAMALNAGFVPVRKGGKLPGDTISHSFEKEYGKDVFEIQKDSIEKGQNVLIIDDLIATGGTMLAACELVKALGGNLIGCQLMIELPSLKGIERVTKVFKGIPFKVLINY